jgi:hypothetical protein
MDSRFYHVKTLFNETFVLAGRDRETTVFYSIMLVVFSWGQLAYWQFDSRHHDQASMHLNSVIHTWSIRSSIYLFIYPLAQTKRPAAGQPVSLRSSSSPLNCNAAGQWMTRLGVHLGPRRRSKLVNDSERIASFTSLLLPVPSKGCLNAGCAYCLV